ncbi:MAG TPA: hypothetical protein VML54_10875 [Candidatus Limnocylindrales bacterium]|nr:hypothetical protein [Candidatus Limnocylindrales bacterium]
MPLRERQPPLDLVGARQQRLQAPLDTPQATLRRQIHRNRNGSHTRLRQLGSGHRARGSSTITGMRRISVSLGLVFLLGWAAPAVGQGFLGLERLYFERTAPPWPEELRCAEAVGRLLPERAGGDGEAAAGLPNGICGDYGIRDFDLPAVTAAALGGGAVRLRQVTDFNHPRIHDQYWCLYADGRRADCWFFSPSPSRTDDKLLNALPIHDLVARDRGELVLRVHGTMVRPQGGWWERGVELTFEVAPGELRYRRAIAAFTVIQPYDRAEPTGELDEHGDAAFEIVAPPPMVAAETLDAGEGKSTPGVVRRAVHDVTDELAAACDVPDLREATLGFDAMRDFALCVTRDPAAQVTRRALDAPAFFERGGEPIPRE